MSLKNIQTAGFILVLLILSVIGSAQVRVQFNPAINGQSIQSLSMVQFFNSSNYQMQAVLHIKVKELSAGSVISIKTTPFYMRQGLNFIDRTAFSNAVFSFSGNNYGKVVKESGKFPEGEYEYCFELEILETKDPSVLPRYDQCFISTIQPLTPLLLLSPVDGDEMCNKRPSFIWQPPLPLSPDSRFRLILAEIKDKQDPIEAITFNTPMINQSAIAVNSLNYPVNIPELREGGRYAWQVTVYTDKMILKKSEIWTFLIKCSNTGELPPADSYRRLKEEEDGDYYLTNNVLRFSFSNPYGGGGLSYVINCVSDPKVVVKNLRKLVLSPGLNRFDLDLTENNSIKVNNEYLLKVLLPDGRVLRLRFIYKSAD